MEDLDKRVEKIEERNKRVELDKAWEISWTRKLLITGLTYLSIVLFFYFADLPRPFLNSIVPATGFVLSTLSLSFFKKLWINHLNDSNK